MKTGRATHLPYMPAIDGLRAVSVLAVFFYHVKVRWMPGGFLGVDVFFVISGYLITALLISEFQRNGYIDVFAFWLRRARRLLPAVAAMIAITLVIALIFVPGEVQGLRDDALASLFYVNNWHLVLSDQSYFETFARPSLLRHLWSLSVEEQFYLLWPIACAFCLRRFGIRHVLYFALGGIALSTLLMIVLYDPTANGGARAFYGTDTRAAALFVGVALAVVWHPSTLAERNDPRTRLMVNGLGALGMLMVFRTFFTVRDYDSSVYQTGFLLIAVWAGMLVMALAHPKFALSPLLSNKPAVWLGERSYAFYLWHWPIVTLTRPDIDVPFGGAPLIILQLLATIGAAELSYRYVETPFRRRTGSPQAPAWLKKGRVSLAAGVAFVVLIVGWSGIAPAQETDGPSTDASFTTESEAQPPPAQVVENPRKLPVLAIGDSVMVGAGPKLQEKLPNATVDAAVGRQAAEYPGVIDYYRSQGLLSEDVVIQVGNNGPVEDSDMAAIRDSLRGVDHVYFVNVEVPRSWEAEVNEELTTAIATWPEATIVDWQAAIENRLDLTYDGIHPVPEGDDIYVGLIVDAIEAANSGVLPPATDPEAETSTTESDDSE